MCCTAQRFRSKLFTHANSHCFTDAGLCSVPQPNSHRDSKRPYADQSQSDAKSNSKTDSDSDPHAVVSGYECHTNAHACACVPLIFEKYWGFLPTKSKTRQRCWRVLVHFYLRLIAIQQHSIAFFCAVAHRTIEQLIAFKVNLNERRTRGDRALNQRL